VIDQDNTAGDLRLRVEMLERMVNRLQAERNRRVESTELGKLSEELEEDNWGSAATLVRSAMHELEDLRGRGAVPLGARVRVCIGSNAEQEGVVSKICLDGYFGIDGPRYGVDDDQLFYARREEFTILEASPQTTEEP
jgi:hypothetical protein